MDSEIIKSDSEMELMREIANGNYNEENNMSLINKDKTINGLKLFCLVQSKKELQRVISLTEFLDKVQNKYQERVMKDLDTLPLKEFPTVIATITACLSRADAMIQRVLKDDTLTQLILIDNSTNKTTIGTSNQLNLDTPDSRDRVVKVVKNMLNVIDSNMNPLEENEGD